MSGVPKGHHWGVDSSFMRIDQHVAPGKPTLFELVMKQAGAVPSFWGRYIGFKGTQLQTSEITFLRRNSPGTRLLLLYNALGIGFFEDTPRNPAAERRRGFAHAVKARAIASDLGAPAGVAIYANAEPPLRKDGTPLIAPSGKISSDWILGWWEGFGPGLGSLSGGIYGNTNGGGQLAIGRAYEVALRKAVGLLSKVLRPPLYAQNTKRVASPKPADINFGYEAQDPPESPGASKVWQYAVAFGPDGKPLHIRDRLGMFDTDLATQGGFDGMWKLTPLGTLAKGPAPQEPRERPPLEEERLA